MNEEIVDVETLKSQLHEAVENIDDEEFLRSLALTIAMKYIPTSDRVVISKEQRVALDRAKQQIENGNFVTLEQSNERADRWLKE